MSFLVCRYLISPFAQKIADAHPQSVRQCASQGVRCERCAVYNFRSV